MAASNSPVEENESPHDHMIEEMSLEQFKLLRHLPFGLRPQFDVNILTYCPQPVSKEEKTIYPFRFQVGTVENRGKFYGLWAFLQKAEKFADIVFFIKWDENRLLYFPIQDQRDGWMVSVKLIPELSGLDLTPEHASAIAKFVLLKYGLLPVISYMGRDIPVFDCGGSGWIKSLFEACNIFKNKDKAVLNPNPPQPTSPPLVKQNNSPEAPVQKQANRSRNTNGDLQARQTRVRCAKKILKVNRQRREQLLKELQREMGELDAEDVEAREIIDQYKAQDGSSNKRRRI